MTAPINLGWKLVTRCWAWLKPVCLARGRFGENILAGLLFTVAVLVLGLSFSALLYFIYASTGNPIRWRQAFIAMVGVDVALFVVVLAHAQVAADTATLVARRGR